MKIFKLLLLFLFLGLNTFVLSQETNNQTVKYQPALKERVFLHYNSSLYLAGEKMLYKAYCIKARNKQLSNLSKVVYIELITSEKDVLFKHTLKLNQGIANGSFEIPTTVKSGNYKLIAYTNWMRNEGDTYFFQGDISIVNTLMEHQELSQSTTKSTLRKMPIVKRTELKSKNDLLMVTPRLSLDKSKYNKRDRVAVQMLDFNNDLSDGNYSISVKKIDDFFKPFTHTSETYTDLFSNSSTLTSSKVAAFHPELKGDVLRGKVVNVETNSPAKNVRVVLSYPNDKFKFRFAITNDLGVFEFVFKSQHVESDAIIQVLHPYKENYKLSVFKNSPLDYKAVKFNQFYVDANSQKQLSEMSVQLQIEKAYDKQRKEGRINSGTFISDFKAPTKYELDDYNRFPTLKETILEIVKNVRVSKKQDNYKIHVRNSDGFDEVEELPLVIVDGVFIQNHNDIVNYNANLIKSIGVIRDKYIYGSFVFQGVVFIDTFNGNYKGDSTVNYMKSIRFHVPSEESFVKKYIDNIYDRIPDYRRQLFWKPSITSLDHDNFVIFYTSDVTGEFEISLEGFSKKGRPISLKKRFTVY